LSEKVTRLSFIEAAGCTTMAYANFIYFMMKISSIISEFWWFGGSKRLYEIRKAALVSMMTQFRC
jgi:hypothetical protein